MATIQKDPKLMETQQVGNREHMDYAEEPDTNADPEGAESRAPIPQGVTREELKPWLTKRFFWQRIRKDDFPDVAECVKAGFRAFMLKPTKVLVKDCMDSVQGVYDALATVKLDGVTVQNYANAITTMDEENNAFLGEWDADDAKLRAIDKLQRDLGFITYNLICLLDYQNSAQYNEAKGDNWEAMIISAQERAAKRYAALHLLTMGKGDPCLKRVKLQAGVRNFLDAQANREGRDAYHPEEISAYNVQKGAVAKTARSALTLGMLGRKVA